ncbi:hypothetical protein ACG94X_02375 [Acinetobacter sp. ULE_I010]|uniref:hypothetical protein n=1 Tax=Acinetobacter sp. ULE_I010 TaxID=3373065 RepID=UPI003AF8AA30
MLLNKIKESSLVDLLTIFTPFILIMGLINKIGIYNSKQVDASWFITIFTPTDLMLSDLSIYLYFIIAILYLDKIIFKPDFSHWKELLWANIQLSSAYIGLYILFWFQDKDSGPLTFFISLMLLSLNGFGLIAISKSVGKIFGFGFILLVPYLTGNEHAEQLKLKNLPIVELEDKKQWYLLDKQANQLILINTQKNKNEFKIVEMKEIKILK